MAKFRKKPVEIEAVQYVMIVDGMIGLNNEEGCPWWLMEAKKNGDVNIIGGELSISTLEGRLHVSTNDWIIQGVKGEIYPCKPDIFASTYEEIPE